MEVVEEVGTNWAEVAQIFCERTKSNKSIKQCRERFSFFNI